MPEELCMPGDPTIKYLDFYEYAINMNHLNCLTQWYLVSYLNEAEGEICYSRTS